MRVNQLEKEQRETDDVRERKNSKIIVKIFKEIRKDNVFIKQNRM